MEFDSKDVRLVFDEEESGKKEEKKNQLNKADDESFVFELHEEDEQKFVLEEDEKNFVVMNLEEEEEKLILNLEPEKREISIDQKKKENYKERQDNESDKKKIPSNDPNVDILFQEFLKTKLEKEQIDKIPKHSFDIYFEKFLIQDENSFMFRIDIKETFGEFKSETSSDHNDYVSEHEMKQLIKYLINTKKATQTKKSAKNRINFTAFLGIRKRTEREKQSEK
jgi:hypothetical protein